MSFVPFQYTSNQNINDQAKNRGSQKLPRVLIGLITAKYLQSTAPPGTGPER